MLQTKPDTQGWPKSDEKIWATVEDTSRIVHIYEFQKLLHVMHINLGDEVHTRSLSLRFTHIPY